MSDDEMMSEGEEEMVVADLTNSDVVTKYRLAADIVNETVQAVVKFATPGRNVLDICKIGDKIIEQKCSTVFKSKKIEKGIAFPTCVSVNECVCHYSPLSSESNVPVLVEGDLVKVDLGAHIDGFVAVAAHTFVVTPDNSVPTPVTGRAADVMKAAYTAAEACVKLIKPGVSNSVISNAIAQVANDFELNSVQGVLMHEMKQYV
mmetsp:Transcript_15050/g.26409  ORF Transcript_15050/g.26409 Transcript_15050/m.26409 type:complete len:204 (+) Transcript_15050:79-690(+)